MRKKPVRDQTFTVTCTVDEKKRLMRRAQAQGRTICGYVRWLIAQEEARQNDRA